MGVDFLLILTFFVCVRASPSHTLECGYTKKNGLQICKAGFTYARIIDTSVTRSCYMLIEEISENSTLMIFLSDDIL